MNISKNSLMAVTKNNQERDREGTPYNPEVSEKTSLGDGVHNTGVTSGDPEEKELIEKQGTMAKLKPREGEGQPVQDNAKNDLTSKDIPDSTNESEGRMGSGQRQDTN
jgi:hypothetical protein